MSDLAPDQKVHELKCWPEYFQYLRDGSKPFEIRHFDRDYEVGDVLLLREFVPVQNGEHPQGWFTGEHVRRVITYMTTFQQKPGNVVLGLRNE